MTQDEASEKFIEGCKRIAKLQKKHGADSQKLKGVKDAYETFVAIPSDYHYNDLIHEIEQVEKEG